MVIHRIEICFQMISIATQCGIRIASWFSIYRARKVKMSVGRQSGHLASPLGCSMDFNETWHSCLVSPRECFIILLPPTHFCELPSQNAFYTVKWITTKPGMWVR